MIVTDNGVQVIYSQPVTELLNRIDMQLAEYVKDFYPEHIWTPILKRPISMI